MIVYKLTSPSGNSYIGITKNTLNCRFQRHCNSNQCRTLKLALDKYGKDNFNKEILYETDDRSDLLEKEKTYGGGVFQQ